MKTLNLCPRERLRHQHFEERPEGTDRMMGALVLAADPLGAAPLGWLTLVPFQPLLDLNFVKCEIKDHRDGCLSPWLDLCQTLLIDR